MSDTVSTILILAVVAMFEGVRRVAPGAFVLRRVLFGRWRVARPLELGRDYVLTAWPIPVAIALVLDEQHDGRELPHARQQVRIRSRLRRTRAAVMTLRVLGVVILMGLVVGVPLATRRWDVWGLVMSLEVLILLCTVQAIVTYIGLRRAAAPRREAFWGSIRMLWPFVAPRGADSVLERVVDGASPIVITGELLGRDALLRALRPRVYDELHDGAAGSGVVALYGRETIAGFLRTPPADESDFCPRCGSGYQPGVNACRDCDGVSLVSSRS